MEREEAVNIVSKYEEFREVRKNLIKKSGMSAYNADKAAHKVVYGVEDV